MRKLAYAVIGLIAGYVLGAVIGYFGIELFSPNTHDRSLEAGMTAAFFTGPIGAVLGLIFGLIRAARRG